MSDLWEARQILTHVRDHARARRASPWAVLGCVLARVTVATPPGIVLPPLVGGPGSTNLYVGLVGPSGAGKGAAESAAADALTMPPELRPAVIPLGSGEGISRAYSHREKMDKNGPWETIQDRDSVLFTCAEVDTLTAINGRQGSTLLAELRKAWIGEDLGFGYASPDKQIIVRRHTYRAALIVGIQPARAGGILSDADGGTPQRLVWLPVADQDAPDALPDPPEPMRWRLPEWRAPSPSELTEISVCDAARRTIDVDRLARLRGEDPGLESHALLARLKVGAALGILDRRYDVDDEDWQLADIVMRMSTATRENVIAYMAQARQARSVTAGISASKTKEIVDDTIYKEHVERVGKAILRFVKKSREVKFTKRKLRDKITSRDKRYFEDAVGWLECSGALRLVEDDGVSRIYELRT
jgi:hypothetical protein